MSHEYIGEFLHTLVGTPEAADALQARLAGVALATEISSGYAYLPDELPDDPFDRLEVAIVDVMTVAANDTLVARGEPSLDDQEAPDQHHPMQNIFVNGVAGMLRVVGALRALGVVYRQNATVPQHPNRVRASIDTVLGRMYDIAGVGGDATFINLEAGNWGLDPDDPGELRRLKKLVDLRDLEGVDDFGHAFQATVGPEGQLVIDNRFVLYQTDERTPCLAMRTRVTTAEGVDSGLRAFMGVVGEVALRIYPSVFPMTSDAS